MTVIMSCYTSPQSDQHKKFNLVHQTVFPCERGWGLVMRLVSTMVTGCYGNHFFCIIFQYQRGLFFPPSLLGCASEMAMAWCGRSHPHRCVCDCVCACVCVCVCARMELAIIPRLLVSMALGGCGSWWVWLLVGVALGESGQHGTCSHGMYC